MKKFLVWLLSIVTALFCLVGCATPDEFETSHTITYYAVIDGTVGSIPAAMYDADTSKYPATYVVGVGAKIGALNSTDKYTFVGWYTDGECKTAFTEIDTNATEKVVVYAKITSVQDPEEDINNDKYWTKNY